jgi:hypothetical protein
MDRKTLKALQHHAQAAADIITNDVVMSAADVLADPTADPRDSLAALVDAAALNRIAGDARAVRKGI